MTTREYTFDLSFTVDAKSVQAALSELHALLTERGLEEANACFTVLCEDDDQEFAGEFGDDRLDDDSVIDFAEFRWVGGERDGQLLKERALLWA